MVLFMKPLKKGDPVTIYIDDKRRYIIRLNEKDIFGTDKGFIRHSDIIGKEYGAKIYTSRNIEAYLFKPLLIDYQYSIVRKTQIIYPKDASLMIYYSGITSGSRVVEAGVGSGFLTISLAHYVGDQGKIYGFDIVEKHLEIAKENLVKAGLIDRVILENRDIREGIELRDIDAVFYDLPDPWNALETAYRVLKHGHPILIYVPTINQVEKTVIAMKKHHGFKDIHVYEVLLREYEVEEGATRPKTLMIGHTGYIVFARTVS